MANLTWFVTVDDETIADTIEVACDMPAELVRIHPEIPAGRIEKITAQMKVSMEENELAFFNGFQVWTHSVEYRKNDKMQSLNAVPKPLLDAFHLEAYGDYYFVDYPDKPGMFHGFSWCYIRQGEQFRLMGSLDERPGYTIFRYDAERGLMVFERDCTGVVHPGGELAAFDLFFAAGDENAVFDAWFAAQGCKSRGAAPIKGYTSWYNHYENINEDILLADLEGCLTLYEPGDLFQIDDGWEPAVGDWLEPDRTRFSMGLETMAELAHMAGFKAGLWLAPFVCERKSALYKEHPDWLLQHDGKPWYCGCNWSNFVSLDIDNPEVQDYLARVFDKIFNEWDFDLVKLDFLYGAAPFGTESESRAGRMIRALEMLRTWCGDKLILGCGVPVMPAFGIVDYCRIGCDTALDWDGDWYMRPLSRERASCKNAIDDIIYRRQLDGRAFGSDPDVFFLRDKNVNLDPVEKITLAETCAAYGSVLLTSDDPSTYSPEARSTYKHLLDLWRDR